MLEHWLFGWLCLPALSFTTTQTHSVKNLPMKYDCMVSKWPAVSGNSVEKLKFDLHGGQFPGSGGGSGKTKDKLQVVKSFILSKTSSTISL